MQERFESAFAKWATNKGRHFNKTADGRYADYRVEARWFGWKAAWDELTKPVMVQCRDCAEVFASHEECYQHDCKVTR